MANPTSNQRLLEIANTIESSPVLGHWPHMRALSDGELLRHTYREIERLRAALKDLIRGYVSTLEAGRDRIASLGGDCDSVEVMERGDPYLRKAREALSGDSSAPETSVRIEHTCPNCGARLLTERSREAMSECPHAVQRWSCTICPPLSEETSAPTCETCGKSAKRIADGWAFLCGC